MNHEQQLQLQAYLDGELTEREASRVADWLASSEEAQKLFAELEFTKSAVSQNEPVHQLPESREFFWSKIERDIRLAERGERTEREPISIMGWLQRILVPVASVAVVAFLAVITMNRSSDDAAAHFAEVESASEMGTMTFRSESERMTVVWVYSRPDSAIASDSFTSNFYK